MKKFISVLLIVVFTFAFNGSCLAEPVAKDMISTHTSQKTTVTEEDGYIIERTTIIKGEPRLVKVESNKTGEITPLATEETFTYQDYATNRMVVKNTAGIPCCNHDIEVVYEWEETWVVDQQGNKIRKISETDPLFISADDDYEVYAGYTLKDYDFDWDSQKAIAEGYIENILIGGGKTFTHSFYAIELR
ncbi:MAG TPA: hypothetical protein GXX35_04515 [Thermoanaerobacterales bacterium]|nr:hypothetical protein [Thermoanaerobacterales bacterium]